MPVEPPIWDEDELTRSRQVAIDGFRAERLNENLGRYTEHYELYSAATTRLLAITNNLVNLLEEAPAIVADDELLYVARYLAGPPISADDLQTLAGMSISAARQDDHGEMAERLVGTIVAGLDRRRFSWIGENREPRRIERRAAIVATAALIASQRVRTGRANTAKKEQEDRVKERLREVGFDESPARSIPNVFAAPPLGHFTGECKVGETRKADVVVRLWDKRVMPIECKVSNSELNSVKRLTNDAAAKAAAWIDDLGRNNVVPAAVLSGVFSMNTLHEAQGRGLSLFWAHSLDELAAFIEATKEE